MTIRSDHTIVPTKDKIASAKFFAEIPRASAPEGRGGQAPAGNVTAGL